MPYTNLNSKWIKGLNVRPETIKYAEENIGTKLRDHSLRSVFCALDPKGKGNNSKGKCMG